MMTNNSSPYLAARRFFSGLFLVMPMLSFGQVEFSSSNLPIVVIDTRGEEIPDEPKIVAHMGIIDNGDGVRNFVRDPFNHYNGAIGIEIRGAGSQAFPKKQYAIETRQPDGENLNVSLLGLPDENDWILYAPYSDKSLMRNALAYKLARDPGNYASRTRFCELVLNGEYMGLYVFTEKIKQDKNRVDLKKLDEDDVDGIDVTGGYIITIDARNGDEISWKSPFPPYKGASQKIRYLFHDPDHGEIRPQQEAYITGFLFRFEFVLAGQRYQDPFVGYYHLIDSETFVDFFIMQEITKNVDGYRRSTYLHKDRDDVDPRLKMGPVWDFNSAFGNADFYDGNETFGWQVDFAFREDAFQIPFWWQRLLQDPVFENRLACRWNTLRENLLSDSRITALIDSMAAEISEARERNFRRWPVLGTHVWPNAFVGQTYAEEVGYLKSWISQRLAWMDDHIPAECSEVNWTHPESIEIVTHNTSGSVSLQRFFSDAVKVDSITFANNSEALFFTGDADSLYYDAHTPGEYAFKSLAWRGGTIVDLSPRYHLTVTAPEVPKTVVLHQNFPNPFNAATTIRFDISRSVEGRKAKVEIFNIYGQKVKTVFTGVLPSGLNELRWDGTDESNRPVTSGVYFYRVTAGAFAQSRKMLLSK